MEAVPQPYSIEIEPDGATFRWKVRERGKLRERSQRLYETAEAAQNAAWEAVEQLRHGAKRQT